MRTTNGIRVVPSALADLFQALSGTTLVLTLVLSTGCGLLDTNQPNLIDPGGVNTPEGAASLRLGALADFVFVKDGEGRSPKTG